MNTLTALWDGAEARQPDKLAVASGERLTYRQVGGRIRALAARFETRWQIRRGEIVALLAPNCAEFVVTYFAALRQGATVQPVDERLHPDEIARVLLDSGAIALVVHEALWPKLQSVRDRLPAALRVLGVGSVPGEVERFDAWTQPTDVIPAVPLEPGDIAELMYTSGTTGEPKAVMRSHANVRAAARNAITGFGYRGDDVIAVAMPLSHSSALNSQLVPILQLGGTTMLLDRFDVDGMLEAIRAEGVTCLRAVPTMIRLLLTSPEFCAEALPSLRLLVNSSAPIDPQAYTVLKERFETIEVMNSYGLTEASTCTVLPDALARSHAASVGYPVADVEMCVMDEAGRTLADGEVGEICIRGEHVFAGYRNRLEETHRALAGGWLHTGDLGHRDRDGLYYLQGRRDDVIKCGGHRVVPLEVESCILRLSAVAEVAVVGMPHRILGQVVRAFVVPRDPGTFDPRDVMRHCRQSLPSHKVPFVVTPVAALPKNSVGKVVRQRLHELDGSELSNPNTGS